MGQGRNTIFLARKGWKAVGFDPAEDGLDAAREAAARAGVTIEAIESTHEAFDFGTDRRGTDRRRMVRLVARKEAR